MSRLWRTNRRTEDGKWKIVQCSVRPETAIDHNMDHHDHHHERDGSVLSINLLRLEEHQWWARGRRNLTRIDHEAPLIWWSMMVVMIIITIINHDEPLQHHQPLWIWSKDLRYIVSMKIRRFEGDSFSACGASWRQKAWKAQIACIHCSRISVHRLIKGAHSKYTTSTQEYNNYKNTTSTQEHHKYKTSTQKEHQNKRSTHGVHRLIKEAHSNTTCNLAHWHPSFAGTFKRILKFL